MTQSFVVFLTLDLNSAIYKKFLEKLYCIRSSYLAWYQPLFGLLSFSSIFLTSVWSCLFSNQEESGF
jgi:hypothetical protein